MTTVFALGGYPGLRNPKRTGLRRIVPVYKWEPFSYAVWEIVGKFGLHCFQTAGDMSDSAFLF
jgi:hypothetical protein